ncbi:MAG: response regulator [Acidimicrobiia bacterium]|nr:response regulator [Acidimicrobiia bacterium]
MSRTALVVDDSRAIRALLKRLLVRRDFAIHEAGNGREGLDRLVEVGPVDLVLVDWNMPEMDGLEFIKAVRSQSAYERVVIVMVTSESEPAHIARALMAGADEYAIKPLTGEGLVEKLELVGLGAN